MSERKTVWSGFKLEDAEANLEKWFKPADPDAYIVKKGDRYQIRSNGKIEMKSVIKKEIKNEPA